MGACVLRHSSLGALRAEISACASNEEVIRLRQELRAEISACASKEDVELLRSEMRSETRGLRSDIAALRSDLTQVALAVGAHLRASEG